MYTKCTVLANKFSLALVIWQIPQSIFISDLQHIFQNTQFLCNCDTIVHEGQYG